MKISLQAIAHCCLAKITTGRIISSAHGDRSGQDRPKRLKSGLLHHQWGLCRGSNVAFQKWGTLVSACGRHGRSQEGYRSFFFFFFTGVSVGPECVFLVEGGANWTLLCMWPHSFYGLLLHPGHLFCPFLFLLNPP